MFAPLTRILRNAKSVNPGLLISLDPGAIWSARLATDRMVELAELGDLIFLNDGEARLWRASALVRTFSGIVIERRSTVPAPTDTWAAKTLTSACRPLPTS